jgi:polyhydroxyalkanoate synthesis regulator phasin
MIEYNQIAKQAVVFQKSSFINGYDAVARVQDQAAEAVDTLMNQTSLVPEAGRQVIKNWVNACQEERDRFKSYVEDGFSSLEKRFAGESESAPKAIAQPKN